MQVGVGGWMVRMDVQGAGNTHVEVNVHYAEIRKACGGAGYLGTGAHLREEDLLQALDGLTADGAASMPRACQSRAAR